MVYLTVTALANAKEKKMVLLMASMSAEKMAPLLALRSVRHLVYSMAYLTVTVMEIVMVKKLVLLMVDSKEPWTVDPMDSLLAYPKEPTMAEKKAFAKAVPKESAMVD